MIFPGDTWQNAKEPAPPKDDRARKQHGLNLDFAFDLITLDQWRDGTDDLSKRDAAMNTM